MFQPHPDVPWVAVGEAQTYAGGMVAYQAQCQICQAEILGDADSVDLFASAHASHVSSSPTHLGMGDLVSKLAKSLGFVKPCTPCEERRQAMNAAVPRVPFTRR